MANYFGKRPIFVFCTFLLCVCYIWGATAQSFKSLLWSNIIAAFGGSASEAVAASMVNDLYFLHERAGKMSWYVNSISAGNTLGVSASPTKCLLMILTLMSIAFDLRLCGSRSELGKWLSHHTIVGLN